MTPKFKGSGDDWFDDEHSSSRTKSSAKTKKKSLKARATDLPDSEANATVIEVFPNQARVRIDSDNSQPLCSYRRAGIVGKFGTEVRDRTPVAVGDRVKVELTGSSTGVIEGIAKRKNFLGRPAPGREVVTLQHVIAANLDVLVIVASASMPEFSPGLVDRFLIAASAADIPTILAITKIDLNVEMHFQRNLQIYENLKLGIHRVSSKTGEGIDELKRDLAGKTVVFAGQSGVGKTTLLRNLTGHDIGRVSEVSEATGKGKHTTTSAVMIDAPENSKWIDTPGIREFGLAQIEPSELKKYFPEFHLVQCASNACDHAGEDGCLVEGFARYPNYLRILTSLKAGEH